MVYLENIVYYSFQDAETRLRWTCKMVDSFCAYKLSLSSNMYTDTRLDPARVATRNALVDTHWKTIEGTCLMIYWLVRGWCYLYYWPLKSFGF